MSRIRSCHSRPKNGAPCCKPSVAIPEILSPVLSPEECSAFKELACPEGLEPPTCCLEGNCSIQLSYGQRGPSCDDGLVGAAGFELATYWSQTSCATRLRYAPNGAIVEATLHAAG